MPLLYLALAAAAAYVLNVFLIRYAQRMRALGAASPTAQVRWASRSKPLVGGITFFIVFFGLIVFAQLDPSLSAASPQLLPLVIVAVLGFLIGLFDDAYNTRPLLKFGGQFAVGVIMLAFGVHIHLTGVAAIDYGLTLIWVVGIMNSYNMMDNMDAVSAIFSLVVLSALAIVLLTFHPADALMLTLTLGLIGAHLGFLLLNWNPSKLYMGDTGSQFIGAVLAYLGVVYFWAPQPSQPTELSWRALSVPVLVYGVTILDTAFVTVARLARGQSPFVGGRDHISHHLVYFGIAERWVPVVLGFVGVLSTTLALAASVYHQAWTPLANLGLLVYVALVVAVFTWIYRTGAARHARLVADLPTPASTPKPVEKPIEKALPRMPAHV